MFYLQKQVINICLFTRFVFFTKNSNFSLIDNDDLVMVNFLKSELPLIPIFMKIRKLTVQLDPDHLDRSSRRIGSN